jgi:hypothetical protein
VFSLPYNSPVSPQLSGERQDGLKRPWRLVLSLALSVMFFLPAGAAEMSVDHSQDGAGGDYICTTQMQLRFPQFCPPQGPGGRLEELARQGLYPERPLPLARYDPDMAYLPYEYVRVVNSSAKLYPNATSAINGTNPDEKIGPGFVYYTYLDKVEKSKGTAYKTRHGFVSGADTLEVDPPTFHGLAFRRTPDRPFGWVVEGGTCSQTAPGSGVYNDPCYLKYSVVQVYDRERLDDIDWVQIGAGEWVEGRFLALITPDATRPEGIEADATRWIVVNLHQQTIEAYADGELAYATLASTGRDGWWTKPGDFQVWARLERDLMTGGVPGDASFYNLDDVPWVLYFDEARALHGTYWHDRFGTRTSRGCVNLTPADAHWLFDFAEQGTWVHVWDPSGETPTDPSLYTAGGA